MKWKDVLIGALVTLAITVIGGVIVYYVTKEPPSISTEKLIYSIEDPQNFATQSNEITIQTIRVGNLGNETAKNVKIAYSVATPCLISDTSISLSSGPAGDFTINKKSNTEQFINIEALTPDETITISLLLNGIPKKPITVGVKSDRSVAIAGKFIREVKREIGVKDSSKVVAAVLIPIALIMQILIMLFLRPRVRAVIRKIIPTFRSINNTAFLYIHQGLIDEAESMLNNGINEGGADAHMLANHALCLGLKGETDIGLKKLEAADFYSEHNPLCQCK